jgi:hypothetical protein
MVSISHTTNNQLAYSAKVDRLLIRKEAVIAVAKLSIDYIVREFKDLYLYLWLSRQAAAKSYFKDLKMYLQSLVNNPGSLER